MSFVIRILRAAALLRSRLLWGWRFRAIGRRSWVGRCRHVVNPGCIEIGEHVSLESDWFLADLDPESRPAAAKIRIGDWCTILDNFQCNAAVSVEIEDHVLIASRVLITDSDHVVDPEGERTTRNGRLVSSPVRIEHDCWLGQNAVILKGVRIGHHSIIGANAVVTRDVPPCSIVAGAPARVIGTTRRAESEACVQAGRAGYLA